MSCGTTAVCRGCTRQPTGSFEDVVNSLNMSSELLYHRIYTAAPFLIVQMVSLYVQLTHGFGKIYGTPNTPPTPPTYGVIQVMQSVCALKQDTRQYSVDALIQTPVLVQFPVDKSISRNAISLKACNIHR